LPAFVTAWSPAPHWRPDFLLILPHPSTSYENGVFLAIHDGQKHEEHGKRNKKEKEQRNFTTKEEVRSEQ
jgi:hypothetical protein